MAEGFDSIRSGNVAASLLQPVIRSQCVQVAAKSPKQRQTFTKHEKDAENGI
jgi:hypothetical protein